MPADQQDDGAFSTLRRQMCEAVRRDMERVRADGAEIPRDQRVLAAIGEVPRHRFVPEEYRDQAYENHPLPIGEGQTISQPFIVALMTALLKPEPQHRVLEIGTGSGYQAAVLSGLVSKVYSVEVVPDLAETARRTLAGLGYGNVETRIGDGHGGWPEEAPFDSIIVTAAAEGVPETLFAQLRPGGRMVIPVGREPQMLEVVEKSEAGSMIRTAVLPVRFVPFTRRRPHLGEARR